MPLQQDTCDGGTSFTLQNGHLIHDGHELSKPDGAKVASFDLSAEVDDLETLGPITFVDGILHWDASDVGPGAFYVCDQQLYAYFADAVPASSCMRVTVGGVVAVACAEYF